VKPAPFDYQSPTTVDDAIAALSGDTEAKVIAGGQSLVPLMSMRLAAFDELIDLRRIDELRRIDVGTDTVRIGAMVRQAVAEHDDAVGAAAPLLPMALANVGHFQIRNRGTIGGSIAHADPAAELPTVALTLDATMEIAGPAGRREVAAADFFDYTFATAVQDNEILVAVRFPVWGSGSGFAVEEVARRHGDFAIVGAMCGIRLDAGSIAQAAIGMFGVAGTPVRATAAEDLLVGTAADGVDAMAAGQVAVQDLDPPSDIHGSSEYRKYVGAHVVARAVTRAIEEAQRG